MAKNTFTDLVSPLHITISLGKPFYRAFQFPAGFPLPAVVTSRTFAAAGGRPLPPSQQATITLTGRLLEIRYSNTAGFPATSWHEVRFDGALTFEGVIKADYLVGIQTTVEMGLIIVQTGPAQVLEIPYTSDPVALSLRNEALAARDQAQAILVQIQALLLPKPGDMRFNEASNVTEYFTQAGLWKPIANRRFPLKFPFKLS